MVGSTYDHEWTGGGGYKWRIRHFHVDFAFVLYKVLRHNAAHLTPAMIVCFVFTFCIACLRRIPSKARQDPELGPPLARIRTHLSPIGLWDDELDSLRVLLIAETFARVNQSLHVSSEISFVLLVPVCQSSLAAYTFSPVPCFHSLLIGREFDTQCIAPHVPNSRAHTYFTFTCVRNRVYERPGPNQVR